MLSTIPLKAPITVRIPLGGTEMKVDTKEVPLNTAPFEQEGTLFVPLRTVPSSHTCQAFPREVDFGIAFSIRACTSASR